jgi:DegV family protein with EDD domain
MRIVTDSAADLTTEDVETHHITVAPLRIQFPEGELTSEELAPDDFYNRLQAMAPEIPTTSQPSAGDFRELYQRVAGEDAEILSLHISSGLSGTLESARLGASQVEKARIELVDTLTLSGGERFQVLFAALAAKAGWGRQAILERLQQIRADSEVIYTLETLEYLARGGRIGRVQSLAAALLNIKPIITVDKKDGKYNTTGKERTLPRALAKIGALLHERFGQDTPVWVTILHGQRAALAEALEALLREKLAVGRLEILRVSPVLGVHTGPGVVGAAVTPLKYFDGLLG